LGHSPSCVWDLRLRGSVYLNNKNAISPNFVTQGHTKVNQTRAERTIPPHLLDRMPVHTALGDVTSLTKEYDYVPQDPPSILYETFPHPIDLLIKRFTQWQLILQMIEECFQDKKNEASYLCNRYHDAAKSLQETCIPSPIIDAMDIPKPRHSIYKSVKSKIDRLVEKLLPLGRKFNFNFVKDGGVMQNLERMTDHVQQLALLEENRREYLLNTTLSELKALQDSLSNGIQKALSEWQKGKIKAEDISKDAVDAYRTLVASHHDTLRQPGRDIIIRWLRYRSLRDAYIAKMNNLQISALLHQEEAMKTENTLVNKLQDIIHQYLTFSISNNTMAKDLFSKLAIPVNAEQEWSHYMDNNVSVTKAPEKPRSLLFINHDHERTKPLAQAELFLTPAFPWSLRSTKTLRRYVVTPNGYFMKAIDDGKESVLARAFLLSNCYVLEGLTKDGMSSFTIRGVNCCRGMGSVVTDRRNVWEFAGKEDEVRTLLKAIGTKVPVITLPIQRDFALYGRS